ncbi:lipoprotein NlpI [Synechococcus sp. MIT S9509]|nr:lipoprotein NlpI [Synechococcus sp. MIT S9509]
MIPEIIDHRLQSWLVYSLDPGDYAGSTETFQQMFFRNVGVALMICLMTFVPPSLAANVDSYLQAGVEKSESGEYRGALIEFNKAIELDPTNSSAYQYRGVAKAKYGDFEGSIIDYSKSIELDSSSTESYANRGIAKARSGDVPGTVLDFDVAIHMNPDDGNAYFNHGMAMEMSHDLQHACLDWNQAVELGDQKSISFLRKYCQ